MKHEKKPAKAKPAKSVSNALKSLHAKHVRAVGSEALSLKAFARRLKKDGSTEEANLVLDWFHNKRANFKTPPLGIGKTKKKKSPQGKKS